MAGNLITSAAEGETEAAVNRCLSDDAGINGKRIVTLLRKRAETSKLAEDLLEKMCSQAWGAKVVGDEKTSNAIRISLHPLGTYYVSFDKSKSKIIFITFEEELTLGEKALKVIKKAVQPSGPPTGTPRRTMAGKQG